MGITRIKRFRFATLVATVAAAALMVSCGGKQTVSPAQKAATGGFVTITSPASELEEIKRDLESKNIPSGIGIGESNDEQVARDISTDGARTEVAKSVEVHVQRMSESYAQNVSGEAKKIWEEAVRQITDQHVRGSNVHKTVMQFDPESKRYKVYSLVILNPGLFKAAMVEAMAREEEFELRVKKDDMLAKMDANIAAYESKYKK